MESTNLNKDVDINVGLNDGEVNKRVELGLHNKSSKTNEKTIPQIVFHNVFTFFNTILIIIAITYIA